MTTAPIYEVVLLVSRFASSALAAAIWQGLLLAGAAALGLRLLPEMPARVRFAIWFAVFALVFTLSWGLPLALPFPGLGGHAGAGVTAATGHAWLTIDDRWCFWIMGIWAAASLARALSLAIAAQRVRGLWKRARPVPLMGADVLPAGRKLELCVSDEVDRPTVIGFFAPRIVMPQWLLDRLTPAELEQVVLHEAGHLSRRDDWLNLVQKVALVVFPLNPSLAWIERRLCLERELACDERVLRVTGSPVAYAECLARIAEYRLQQRGLTRSLALALGAIGRESELARRVVCLLSKRKAMKHAHARVVFGSAMVLLMTAAVALERTPQLIAFSSGVETPAAEAHHASAGLPVARAQMGANAGFRAVAARAVALPAQEWKTTGDAPARLSVRPKHYPAETKLIARPQFAARDDVRAQQVRLDRDGLASNDYSRPRVVQTVATTREMTADGEIVVTRWVTVSQPNDASSESDAAGWRRVRARQMVVPFAAVPVQGGWLVFQL